MSTGALPLSRRRRTPRSAMSRMAGAKPFMRRGVKRRLTRARMRVWLGGTLLESTGSGV